MDRNELIYKAFQKACKCLREHPPCDAGYEPEFLPLIMGGMIDDPEGKRWMVYFLQKVLAEEKENEAEG